MMDKLAEARRIYRNMIRQCNRRRWKALLNTDESLQYSLQKEYMDKIVEMERKIRELDCRTTDEYERLVCQEWYV